MTKKTAKIFDDGCGCIGTPTKFIKTGGLCGNCITRLYSDWEELEEIHGKTIDIVIDLYHRLEKVEKSRDELLEEYKKHRWNMCRLGVDENIIQKAESLKDKV